MKGKLAQGLHWLLTHNLALINVAVLLFIVSMVLYLTVRPIDVLQDWEIRTTVQGAEGRPPVYHPGGSLEFVSTSRKVESAEGISSRIFDCNAVEGGQAREIMLVPITANRAPGYNPPRENAITVPSVGEFDGLPRECRLVINVCYQNVVLWRDHCERAESNPFLVDEALDPKSIRNQIDELNRKIQSLEQQLLAYENKPATSNAAGQLPADVAFIPPVTSSAEQGRATESPAHAPEQPASTEASTQTERQADADRSTGLRSIPLVDGLLHLLGL